MKKGSNEAPLRKRSRPHFLTKKIFGLQKSQFLDFWSALLEKNQYGIMTVIRTKPLLLYKKFMLSGKFPKSQKITFIH